MQAAQRVGVEVGLGHVDVLAADHAVDADGSQQLGQRGQHRSRLALLLLGGTAFGLSQVLGGDDPTPQPNQSQPPSGQTAGQDGGTNPSVPNEETTVGVLNGTTTNGLAGTLADRLQQEGGYARGTTATNTRDQTLQTTTVYYAERFRSQARSVAELLGVDAVEPMDEETQALAPDADVIVLAGADQAASQ